MTPRFLISLVAAVGLAAACVPAEKEENLGKRWEETTVMGELQRRGTLRMAISRDAPTRVGGAPGAYDEFVLEFARFLADTLGVQLETVEVPISQLQTGIDTGDIDIAFPITPITEESVRTQAFSDPLFISHQRLLSQEDFNLASKTVCSLADPTTGLEFSEDPTIVLRTERDPQVCVGSLLDLDASAVTGPEIVLMAVLEILERIPCPDNAYCYWLSYQIGGDQLTTGGLGAQLRTGAQAWVDYVNLVLDKWIEDGGWAAAYAESFGEEAEPPDLTVEEAAALFPSD